jgi:signal transduction histidine kinase
MSHELRTPLHVIIGYADLAMENLEQQPGDDIPGFLERIAERAGDLKRLVESVLDFANFDRGRVTLQPKRFPIDNLLTDLRSLCHDVPRNPGVTVHIDAAPELEVTSDYDRLYSVLSNILLNGLKFTTAGSVRVAVREADEGIELAVHDTGIGIPPEALAYIFEPFRQADGSPTRHFGGLGLGLAIAQRNLKLLKGRIEVDSQVGKGSTFRVHIPRCLDGGENEPRPAHARPEAAA